MCCIELKQKYPLTFEDFFFSRNVLFSGQATV
jgi:hypothetical protein